MQAPPLQAVVVQLRPSSVQREGSSVQLDVEPAALQRPHCAPGCLVPSAWQAPWIRQKPGLTSKTQWPLTQLSEVQGRLSSHPAGPQGGPISGLLSSALPSALPSASLAGWLSVVELPSPAGPEVPAAQPVRASAVRSVAMLLRRGT